MIIVDLDKLHFPFTTARPEYAQGVQDLHKAILKCKIDAIPVEWIENTRKLAERVQHSKYAYYLKMLLEDWEWEKENEID